MSLTADQALAYVRATAVLLDLPLDPERAARVAEHLTRTAAMAVLLESGGLAPELEPAELFRPAPFPDGEGE